MYFDPESVILTTIVQCLSMGLVDGGGWVFQSGEKYNFEQWPRGKNERDVL